MADKSNRWPLVSQIDQRYESLTQDATLINGYCELDALQKADQQEPNIQVFKRPGWTLWADPALWGTGVGAGIFNWQGDVYAVINGNLVKNGAVVGSGINTAQQFKFTSCMGGTPRLLLNNTAQMWAYDPTDGLVALTTQSQPVKGLAYLDGTIYYVDSGAHVYGSGINDPTTWDADNMLVAQIEPDSAVAIAKQLVYIVVFKQKSIEFFYDAGNATGSPLAPVQGAKISIGCAQGDSIAQLEGALFFVAANEEGGLSVWMIDQLKPQQLSTASVEKLLQADGCTRIGVWAGRCAGHRFYGISLFTLNVQIVYDLESKLWYQWTDYEGNGPQVVGTCIGPGNLTLVQLSDGQIYQLDQTAFTDNEGNYTFQLVTPVFDMNTRMRKTMSRLTVVADRAQNTLLGIEFSDDDYQTWKTLREVDLSTEDPFLGNCGTFRRRAIRLTQTANAPLRFRALEYLADQGTL